VGMLNREDPPVYGADVPVSMPQPPAHEVIVPMYGFGYTRYGLCHDITEAEAKELGTPRYRPARGANTRRGDTDVG